MSDVVVECLVALSQEMGVPALQLDEQGCCALEHGDGFVFTLIAPVGGQLVHLSSRLMDVPAAGREAFFARLLRLNFLHMETSGGTLSIDEEGQGVYLCYSLLRDGLQGDRLLTVVANFLATSSRLHAQLGGAEPGPGSDPAAARQG